MIAKETISGPSLGAKPASSPARSSAAERALAEAAERRVRAEKEKVAAPKEVSGRDGPDPVRYGDWESRGIASDF